MTDSDVVVAVHKSKLQAVGGAIRTALGVQARARLHLMAAENRPAAELVVTYVCNNAVLGQQRYTLPVGYSYSIDNPYLDITRDGHRYIYRPTTAQITGTMASGGRTVTVDYAVALDLYKGVLHVISVDGIEEVTESGETIGVIE